MLDGQSAWMGRAQLTYFQINMKAWKFVQWFGSVLSQTTLQRQLQGMKGMTELWDTLDLLQTEDLVNEILWCIFVKESIYKIHLCGVNLKMFWYRNAEGMRRNETALLIWNMLGNKMECMIFVSLGGNGKGMEKEWKRNGGMTLNSHSHSHSSTEGGPQFPFPFPFLFFSAFPFPFPFPFRNGNGNWNAIPPFPRNAPHLCIPYISFPMKNKVILELKNY